MKVLIAANSPGEVAWVRSLANQMTHRGWTCDVLLYPCSFATGQEKQVLSSYAAVEKVWTPGEMTRLWWKEGARYPAGTPLIHLGGDLMYTAMLQWRWKWRCWSYLWARPWWNPFFEGYFSRNALSTRGLLKRRVDPKRIAEVGDLVVDAVLDAVPETPPGEDLVTFLPGSRQEEFRHFIPFYARVSEILSERLPNYRFQAVISPFLQPPDMRRLLELPPDPRLEHARGQLQGDAFVCQSGLRLPLIRTQNLQHLARSRLAVTIPGTKTAEAAVLGVPTLTLIPLNCPEFLPAGGLLGLLDWLPGGSHLKGQILLSQRHKVGLLAQPNQLLGEALMPERIDRMSALQVADEIESHLREPDLLREKGLRFRQAYLELAGCSQRMLDCLPQSQAGFHN